MSHSKGFTLIELTMAILFISVLILMVAYATINISNIYQKGTTLKLVNQKSRELIDIVRRDVIQATPSQITVVNTDGIVRVCLGGISYVANTVGKIKEDNATNSVRKSGSSVPYKFARIVDPDKTMCSGPPYNLVVDATTEAIDLIGVTSPQIIVYDMNLVQLSNSSLQSLYEFSATIGTFEKTSGTNLAVDNSNRCRPTTDPFSNPNYCSVVELKTIIRSGGA